MKKFLIIVLSVFISTTSFAQIKHKAKPTVQKPIAEQAFQKRAAMAESVIWSDDFENGLDGNNSSANQMWKTYGPDGDIWAYDTDGSNGQFAGSTPYLLTSESAGNGWMIFDADYSNPGNIQAQFIKRRGKLESPYIDLTAYDNVSIKFDHAFRWCCSQNHKLFVGVSVDNGLTWEEYSVNDSYNTNELATTQQTSIIISSIAAGQDSVLIRFDWAGDQETATNYYWMIDDVKIIETPNENSFLVDNYILCPSSRFGGTTYSNIPLSQAQSTSYILAGIIENLGVNTLDSARVIGFVDSENFYDQSYAISLETEQKDTFYCNTGFVPTSIGNYVGQVYGTDDNNVATDTASMNFAVSEFDFARDRSDFNENFGSVTINGEATFQMGNCFDIYADQAIYSIKVYIDEATSPNAKAKAILNSRAPGNNPPSFEDETPFIDLGNYNNEWVEFVFPFPYQATAGQVLLPTIYAEYTDGVDSVVIGSSGISNPGETLIQDFDGIEDGSPGDWFYITSTIMVRLNFDPNVIDPLSVQENKNAFINIYPNPNNGIFNLDVELKKQSNLSINFQNILGQNVFSKLYHQTSNIKEDIDLSNLEKGIYHVIISNKNTTLETQKIIIQ